MVRVGVFQGSFNPIHQGHLEIPHKALHVFDKIIFLLAINPDKNTSVDRIGQRMMIHDAMTAYGYQDKSFEIHHTEGLVVDFITEYNLANKESQIMGIIRGLRNTNDFIYEQAQQYWNEDLGLDIPVMYFISSRDKVHLSSSAIRALSKFKKDGEHV